MYMTKATRKDISTLVVSNRVATRKTMEDTSDYEASTRMYTTGYMVDYLLGLDLDHNGQLLRDYAQHNSRTRYMVMMYAPEIMALAPSPMEA